MCAPTPSTNKHLVIDKIKRITSINIAHAKNEHWIWFCWNVSQIVPTSYGLLAFENQMGWRIFVFGLCQTFIMSQSMIQAFTKDVSIVKILSLVVDVDCAHQWLVTTFFFNGKILLDFYLKKGAPTLKLETWPFSW